MGSFFFFLRNFQKLIDPNNFLNGAVLGSNRNPIANKIPQVLLPGNKKTRNNTYYW